MRLCTSRYAVTPLTRRGISVFAAVLLCPVSALAQPTAGASDVQASVENVIEAIKIVLIDLQNELEQLNVPLLSSAEIQLQTSYAVAADGGINWYVLSADAAYTTTSVQTVLIVLKPPPPHTQSPVSGPPVLAETLTQIVLKAAEGIDAALSSDVPLTATKLSVEVQFVVDQSTTAGGKFRLLPVGFGFSGGVHDVAAQRILLTFGE